MLIIKNNIIPFNGYSTINILGVLFTKKDKLSERTINHESIHSAQMLEMSTVGLIIMILLCSITTLSWWFVLLSCLTFYVWYIIEYIIVRFFHKKQNDSYHDISFEEEAYANEYDFEYLKYRKLFSWFKYISPNSNKK